MPRTFKITIVVVGICAALTLGYLQERRAQAEAGHLRDHLVLAGYEFNNMVAERPPLSEPEVRGDFEYAPGRTCLVTLKYLASNRDSNGKPFLLANAGGAKPGINVGPPDDLRNYLLENGCP